jgi:hypothetical protein
MLDETRSSLEDLQASSKELEDELEKDLANTEKREKQLQATNERLKGDLEEWKVCLPLDSTAGIPLTLSTVKIPDVVARTLKHAFSYAKGARVDPRIRTVAPDEGQGHGARQRRPREERAVRLLPLSTCHAAETYTTAP